MSEKGIKQVGKLTSLKKDKTITVVSGMSAVGTYIPSMFIFLRKRMVDALLNGSPPGSIGHCSSKWVDISLFMRWLVHFQSQVNATLEKKSIADFR